MNQAGSSGAAQVTVTGGNGYIALHVIAQLLMDQFDVVATIRGESNRKQVLEGLSELGVSSEQLTFALCDLEQDEGWEEALTGSDSVIHLASPFPLKPPKHDRDVIGPAVDGTLRLLNAAAKTKIKRFVLTSSTAAILYGHPDPDRSFTARDWSDIEGSNIGAYQKSKTLAEQSAWQWVETHPEADFEFSVINPGLVLGPYLGDTCGTSGELIRKFLAGEIPALPDMGWACVDVRDLAAAHVTAIKLSTFDGHRVICAGPHTSMSKMADILFERYGDERKIPRKQLPNWLVRMVARFDRDVRITLNDLGREQNVDVSSAKELLNWETRSVHASILDMADTMIKKGLV